MDNAAHTPDSDLMLDITACQGKIFAFALSLLGDRDAAADIQQETNLIIWDKVEQAREVKNFTAWAMQIAYYQVKNYRRRQQRSELLFDSDVMELLAEQAQQHADSMDDRLSALQVCMRSLPSNQRELLEQRYHHGTAVKDIARQLSRKASHVSVMLFRIRAGLHNCITQRLRGGVADA